jgi:hypothetical protein
LKEPALDYFETYLVDDPANKPAWLMSFELFTEELYIYFGPYNQQPEAKIELEQLVMKDNHKVMKFFIEFYRISAMLNHNKSNESSLYQKAYTAMPKRVKDELVHFESPEPWMSFVTSFRRLTNVTGNAEVRSLVRLVRPQQPRPNPISPPKRPRTMTNVKVRTWATPIPIRMPNLRERARRRRSPRAIRPKVS